MTGDQLKALRDARGFTREQLAAELGDCSASTINKWERNINPVPGWVEDKMLSNVKIAFPLKYLHQLLDLAREEGISFKQLLSEAISDRLASRREKSQPHPVKSGPTAKAAASPSTIISMPPQHIAADAPADNSDLPQAQKVSYGSGKSRKKKNG